MKSLILRFSFAGLVIMAFTTPLPAQTPAGPTNEQLKAWINVRQQRVDLLREEIKQTDARIESRLDVIIESLTSIADSKDSRTKVARMKEDTMKRLGKTIEYYDQKRRTFRQELSNPRTALTAEDKRRLVAIFDERIEKRTQQILALNKSMPSHQEYERYTVTEGGWNGAEYQRNKDFEQNRRMTSHTNTQRNALLKQLDASIARLDRMGRELRSQHAAITDTALKTERAADIEKNDALIAERRQQRLEVMQSAGTDERGVALKEATDLDQALKKSIEELHRDFNTLFARFNTFIGELTALRANQATLAAASRG